MYSVTFYTPKGKMTFGGTGKIYWPAIELWAVILIPLGLAMIASFIWDGFKRRK